MQRTQTATNFNEASCPRLVAIFKSGTSSAEPHQWYNRQFLFVLKFSVTPGWMTSFSTRGGHTYDVTEFIRGGRRLWRVGGGWLLARAMTSFYPGVAGHRHGRRLWRVATSRTTTSFFLKKYPGVMRFSISKQNFYIDQVSVGTL